MLITRLLKPELVCIGLEAKDKWEVISKLAELLCRSGCVVDVDELRFALEERERTMTTGLGHGVAVPHAMTPAAQDIAVAAATLKEPVDFGSLDGKPVSVAFAIASPPDRDKRYMTILAQIARAFSSKTFAERLRKVETPQQFIDSLKKALQA